MKKIIALLLALVSTAALAQTFTVQNLSVLGTGSFAVRPTFNGNVPWDAGNLTPSIYAPLASPALTSVPTAPTAPSGTNTTQLATTAFVQAAIPGCLNISNFGGTPGGVFDNTPAFNAAKAAAVAQRACISFGPGKWYFASSIGFTSSTTAPASFSLIGAGADVTELNFASGANGPIFSLDGQYNSAHVRDMSITTNGTSSTGIELLQQATTISNPALTSLSDITNVTLRGADGYAATDYWQNAVFNSGVSNVNFTNLIAIGPAGQQGNGIVFGGGTATLPPVQFNVTGSMFMNLLFGINITSSYYQGITVNQSNFTANATAGIVVGAGLTGFDQLTVVNSQFANGVGIKILSQFQNLMIAHNLFICQNIAGVYGIYNNAAVLFSYIGNTFQNANAPSLGNNPTAIYNNNDSGTGGIISGNVIRYFSPAIYLDTSTTGESVQSNSYFNNNTNVSNHGTGNSIGVATP